MPDSRARPASTASSLMQDVPGAFPAPPQLGAEEEGEEGDDDEVTPKTLWQAVYARRAEYVRPKHVRIKVGTWNVAACKGTEKDVGGWYVQGRGLSEKLSGLNINDDSETPNEDAGTQEERYQRKHSTLPMGDTSHLPRDDDVGLYVLGLQEVVDISSATEALRPYTDPSVAKKWKDSMAAALPPGYSLVAEQQLLGLLILIYAHPNVAKDVKSVSTTSVGTGLMGYMGNKGAVTARIVLGETTRLVFVNCHLAAGSDKAALERRNWDAQQIFSRTRFEPIQDAMDLKQTTGEQIGEEDFAFWFGDLNYRLEGIPGDDIRRLLMLHTRNEYDLSQRSAQKINKELQDSTNLVKERVGPENSSGGPLSARASLESRRGAESSRPTTLIDDIEAREDPGSLQTTLSSLLPHDELHQQMRARKAFPDWQEGDITFIPSYKYNTGTVGVFDSSEKKRAPSWCDRILYRTRRDKLAWDKKVRDEVDAKKKDEEMKANGIDQGANDEDILYDYDPETDGADGNDYDEYDEYADAEDDVVITKEGFEDTISLEYYTSHQRVLSSDHKPLDACFVLKYDAVMPDLKAQVHADVARELDKAENEGRPNVVVVVDQHNDTAASSDECLPEKFEGVWFGDVRWLETKHRSLTVANTSRVPANFSFISRPVNEGQLHGIAPKWLAVKINDSEVTSSSEHSETVILEPGESANVELELRITSMDDVMGLNDKKHELEDILVLRVENGRDHFIPVRGKWLESSLGRSIDKLVRIPEGGIRKLQGQKPKGKSKLKAAADTLVVANSLSQNSPKSEGDALKQAFSGSEEYEEPVRFSAPRELFRLTEAVEELSIRVIAEWEMMNAPLDPRASEDSVVPPFQNSAPWDDHPAWPFEEDCLTERTTSHWEQALSQACNALDEDQPLEPALPQDLPRVQRLYVLASLTLLFLQSMTDGIVPEIIWPEIERYLIETEKSKRKPLIDDQRTTIQEILSQSPSHSISFILITSMLERMIQERTMSGLVSAGHSRNNSRDTGEAPISPIKRAGGGLRRMVTGRVPQAQPQREQTCKALAKMFGPAIVRSSPVSGDKARNVLEKRKADIIEVFLKRDEPG